MKQQNLNFSSVAPDFQNYWKKENRKTHGGLHAAGKRKSRRPLSTKKPIHLVMRAVAARGAMSFRRPKHFAIINQLIQKYARRFDIRVYNFSINSNHLHIVLRSKTRKSFQDFLRTIAGLIARAILKAEKGQKKGKLWDNLAFTRISEWGRGFRALRAYVQQNVLEASGTIPYTPRKRRWHTDLLGHQVKSRFL